MTLHALEREIITLRTENAALKASFGQERQRTQSHENKIVVHESAIDQLNKKLRARDSEIRQLQQQLAQKQQLLTQKELEKEKQKKRLNSRFAVEKEKIECEAETRLQQQKNELNVSETGFFLLELPLINLTLAEPNARQGAQAAAIGRHHQRRPRLAGQQREPSAAGAAVDGRAPDAAHRLRTAVALPHAGSLDGGRHHDGAARVRSGKST